MEGDDPIVAQSSLILSMMDLTVCHAPGTITPTPIKYLRVYTQLDSKFIAQSKEKKTCANLCQVHMTPVRKPIKTGKLDNTTFSQASRTIIVNIPSKILEELGLYSRSLAVEQ